MIKPGVYIATKFNGDDNTAIIRKTVIGDDGLVTGVYGLARNGEWVENGDGKT